MNPAGEQKSGHRVGDRLAGEVGLAGDRPGGQPGELAFEGLHGTSWAKQGFTACPALAVAPAGDG